MVKIFSKKLLVVLFLATFVFSQVPLKVSASAQFSTGYDINFVFAEAGQALVTQSITLENLTDNFYASEYSLTISSDRVTNVSGSDGLGTIPIITKTQNNSTILVATLNQKIVGKGKSVNFKIFYTIDSLAVKRGRIWEVNIPQIVTSENVSAYKLTVSVPKNFGKLGKIAPQPSQVVDETTRTNYIFSQDSLVDSGIGASFGDYQLFKFTLKYRYKNPNLTVAKATVALPPDTEYQALYYNSIDPKPPEIEMDENGNYLATYKVSGGKILEVIAQGYAKLVDAEKPFQVPKMWSEEELKAFTKSDKYIESENSQIQKKAKELKNVSEIYDFVVSTLKYDFSRLENDSLGRRGALTAFNKPEQSICTDFSDLFVALARAKGIPARGLIGFAYTDNSDLRPTKIEGLVDTTVLHAWPEYYDRQRGHWVQVDPTWGVTTGGVDYFNRLDTNHFAFAIYGTSSQFPYPAGAYKLSENEVDDVKVEVVDQTFEMAPNPVLALETDKVISGFPSLTKLSLENVSGRALFKTKITVTGSSALGLINPKVIEVGTLLPFAKNTYDLKLRSSSFLDNRQEILFVNLTGVNQDQELKVSVQKEINVEPFFSLEIPQLVLLGIFSVGVLRHYLK